MLKHKEILNVKYENISPIRNYINVIKDHKSIICLFENGKIEINYFQNDIIKVFIGEINEKSRNTDAILEDLEQIDVNFSEFEDYIVISGCKIYTYIDKATLKISFKDKNGNIICEDFDAPGKNKNNIFVSKANDCIAYYGFGEKSGNLNKKGCYLENYNTDDAGYDDNTPLLYKTIPFYIGLKTTNCYGIYFDNSHRSYFDMGSSFKDRIFFGATGGQLQYYFIPGNNIKEVVKNYSVLTGTMPLPATWTLGYQQCRYSYMSQKEVEELADTFRNKQIPCDTIYLDIHYMDEFRVMTFNDDTFQAPKAMNEKLNKNGFKLVTILDPGVKVDEDYFLYKSGIEGDHFVKTKDGEIYEGEVWPGLSAFPDFSNVKARNWWKENLKEFLKLGISGIWNDMNEPAVFDNDYKTMVEDCIHQGDDGFMEHKEFHNLYGMQMSRCSNEAQLELYPNLRPFSMTRDTFAGGQRYSSIWTGDNQSTWHHLRCSIPMNCNLGLSGISYVGNDVGGFGGDTNEELFVRWMELGTFLPIFRNHSAIRTRRQEPWSFGKNTEDICKKFIKLRYKLMPYIYNAFYNSHKEGIPVFRPMIMEFPEDINLIDMYSQFMFGDNLLIAPVLYEGEREKLIYFPKGNWYDFFTGKKYEGEKYYNISLALDELGVFVKENSIIPIFEEDYNYIDEKDLCPTLLVCKGEGSFTYYEDDGISNDYINGKYNLYKISFINNQDKKDVSIETLHKGYESSKNFKVIYM